MLEIRMPLIYGFFFIIWFASCGGRQQVDVSHIDVDIHIERFDKVMDSLQAGNILAKNQEWLKNYDYFYADYMQYMLAAGNPLDSLAMEETLSQIIETADFNALKSSVYETYPNLKDEEIALTDAFRRIKYYFPESTTPRVISFFSGFAVQVPIGHDYIGIGLDMFLGADSKFYPALRNSIPSYISRRFTRENIAPRVVESYIRQELFPQSDLDVNLLQHMVYQGKVLYAMDLLLPTVADSLKIGYTTQQEEWANYFESDIWGWFLQENLLYESDYNRIQKYLGEAPFTPELGEQNESAPKLGVFIGWKIVREYMDRNPEVTLSQLLFEHRDAQQLLNESRYRGGK